MTPYYFEDDFTIWHGDCREVEQAWPLPPMPDKSVMVTDPPYGIVQRYGNTSGRPDGTRTMQFPWDRGGAVTDDVVEGLASFFPHVNAFHTFCGPEQFGRIAEAARWAAFSPKPWAWVKECPPPAMPGNWWPSAFELAMYGYRPGAWFGDADPARSNVYRSDTYRHGIRKQEKVDHPTQKWLPMIQYIIASIVPPDAVVIDPFMGSGTTLVAARQLGRKAVGIDVDEKYCEIAVQRLAQRELFMREGS